jgi:outer membrane protein
VSSLAVKAQNKTGFIYFGTVVQAMPERPTLEKTLQDYQKQFADQFQAMQTEYQTQVAAYEKGRTTMTDAARTAKEAELTDLQGRLQKFSTDAQQKIEARQNELLKPIIDKVTLAANAVAKEKGYSIIIDATQNILVVKNDADDITAAVKLKLAIK